MELEAKVISSEQNNNQSSFTVPLKLATAEPTKCAERARIPH